eukprot:CAMPEP_0170604916 /NCGR_PEP_ID=MMETSP0224-20130122/19694_1 /TAXON_ID=285029 /ORGANISM="Togula jolla, Strain CCCM 725" /LENGTH=61 /DNA_ID=CAMNT_0010929883 /DNA_START=40 /DNA_END=221 /DNA_ORIENTATION=+
MARSSILLVVALGSVAAWLLANSVGFVAAPQTQLRGQVQGAVGAAVAGAIAAAPQPAAALT